MSSILRLSLFTIFIFSQSIVYAASLGKENPNYRKLIACLGQEELIIHKQKLSSALYPFNQEMIGRVLQLYKPKIKDWVVKKTCSPNYSPSLKLLEFMILQPQNIFHNASFKSAEGIQINSSQNNFLKEAPSLLFEFINLLQKEQDIPGCIMNTVPQLANLFEDYKYLATLVPHQQIFTRSILKAIFNSLENIDKILEQCRQNKKSKKPKSK